MKIDLHLRPEFTYELVQAVPYAKWLHDAGQLGTVYTSVGMSPYYFFADSVEEIYNERTIDNRHSGVLSLPNTWLHHNAVAVFGKDYGDMTDAEKIQANGVLDYTQWTPPNYAAQFPGEYLDLPEKLIIINNQYNIEKGMYPTRYFDLTCLSEMFGMLSDAGYTIIYNRPTNTEFTIDDNERATLEHRLELSQVVEGVGNMTDYQLCDYYESVIQYNELMSRYPKVLYNDFQLNLFSRASGFIGLVGGAGTLSCFYQKPTIMYATVSRAIADGYWKPESYYQKLSNQNAHPVVDKREDQMKRGSHDYSKIYELIKELFL